MKAKTLRKFNQLVNKDGKQADKVHFLVRLEDLPRKLQKKFMPKR